MKVILLKDVKNQGKKDDIIEVSDGYGNNYLLKNKLAVVYSAESKKKLDFQIKEREDNENALVAELSLIKKSLNNRTYKYVVKTGKNGKVFGCISSKQICESLLKDGFKIDKKCLFIDHPIDTLGNHIVRVELHKKVVFNINITLINE